MKFVSFVTPQEPERLGLFTSAGILDLSRAAEKEGLKLPATMAAFLLDWDRNLETAARLIETSASDTSLHHSPASVRLLAPVPHPTSCRDAYAFRQHVATARRNRGLEMIPEFDQFPVFYFTNHNGIVGPGDVVVESDHLQQLDFELEAAIVIGRHGKNILAKDAGRYIAGYTIMNDLSARVLQMDEMKLSLGPAKGKDFATAIGPWLVTPGELEPYRVTTDFGDTFNLRMTAHHNGTQISDGNLKQMNWTFAEIIERASYGVELFPGDVIGSGTVGTGCYLELNGSWGIEAKQQGKPFTPIWLQDGDTIELEIAGLGKLTNRIVKSPQDRSILANKKHETSESR
jgi:fumarylacetoacetate (FAA) hydrolase